MKKGILLLLLLLLGFALWWRAGTLDPAPVRPAGTSPTPIVVMTPVPGAPVVDTPPTTPALAAPSRDLLDPIPPHPEAVMFGSGHQPPDQELTTLHRFFELYRERFGSYPTGESNAQYMNALRGNNPGRWGIFPTANSRLTEAGTLLDPWGTPYIFHSQGSQQLEIRSAGPDRDLYTDDDLLR